MIEKGVEDLDVTKRENLEVYISKKSEDSYRVVGWVNGQLVKECLVTTFDWAVFEAKAALDTMHNIHIFHQSHIRVPDEIAVDPENPFGDEEEL
jgi:hypothetical protein